MSPPALVAAPSPIDSGAVTVAELVAQARRGDRAAQTRLYQDFHRAVHGVVLAYVRPVDAADLVQDVFALALARLAQLDEPAAFPGWLMTLARRRAIDHARRRPPPVEAAAPATAPEVPALDAARALAALRTLPAAYREPLVLRLVEGLTGPEIAARTGLTPGSVRVNLCRGMARLRAVLAGSPAPDDDEEAP